MARKRTLPSLLLAAWLACSLLAVAGQAAARGAANGFGDPRGNVDSDDAFSLQGNGYASDEYDAIRRLRQRGAILSLEQILKRARLERDGRLLETELEQHDGRYVYNVELVDERGHVWEMQLDARTGEVLNNRRED